MKLKIIYRLLSFLLLFTLLQTAAAGPVVSRAEGKPHLQKQVNEREVDLAEPSRENDLVFSDNLPDLSLSNTQQPNPVNGPSFKKVQGDKELLLLHEFDRTNTGTSLCNNDIRGAGSVTYIFLLLFPHHFF